MDLFKKLLEKYSAKYVSPTDIEEFFNNLVSEKYSIDPSLIQTSFRNGVLFIQSHAVLKSEILINKKTFLENLRERFPGKVSDIR
jgi:hypothetical protein